MMFGVNFLWYLYKLRKTQWLSGKEIKALQEKKLRAIVQHAYNNVAFYRSRFVGLGLKPSDIRTVEDLKKLPITTRVDLQRNLPRLVSSGVSFEKCQKHRSSGSTGVPVTVLGSGKTESYRAALFARPFFENGLRLRDKMLRITGSPHSGRNWYERLGIMRKIFASPIEPFDTIVQKCKKFKPSTIYGHSSYILLLAREIAENPEMAINPRLLFLTADLLSKKSREFIRAVFGSEIFDFYGCVEVERMAWECEEHSGFHLDSDSQLIEFLDDGGNQVSMGERGKLVVTCLYNYTMPLIRYEVGDVGLPIADACSCGRGLPLMKDLEGRRNDFIRLPSGKLISPTSFLDIDEIPTPGIGQFQVIQDSKNRVIVKIVAGKGFSTATSEAVKKETERILGSEMSVDVEVVSQIERTASGKFQVVKSRITNSSED